MGSRPSALASWSAEHIAIGRRWVKAWQDAAPQLERIRRQELRALDAHAAMALLCGPADFRSIFRSPESTRFAKSIAVLEIGDADVVRKIWDVRRVVPQ